MFTLAILGGRPLAKLTLNWKYKDLPTCNGKTTIQSHCVNFDDVYKDWKQFSEFCKYRPTLTTCQYWPTWKI